MRRAGAIGWELDQDGDDGHTGDIRGGGLREGFDRLTGAAAIGRVSNCGQEGRRADGRSEALEEV